MVNNFRATIFLILIALMVIPAIGCAEGSPYPESMWTQNVYPGANVTYNLGSPAYRWHNLYVDNIIGGSSVATGNVTGSGTPNTITKWTGATTIGNASMTEAQAQNAVTQAHAQNTDIRLTIDGTIQLISAGLLVNDLDTDRWLLSDTNTFLGVDVVGADNLAHTGGAEGWGNTAIGNTAMRNITTSYYNTAVGYQALTSMTTGEFNTAVGTGALSSVTTGQFNTAIGLQALNDETGSYNVGVGLFAGSTNTGDRNVFLGNQAGQNSGAVSNKLYIDSSNTVTPLIYGDFATNDLIFNGDAQIVGALDMNLHQINNLLDPTANQDAATKLYVDTHGASGNVTTAGGTANYIPKFTSETNIEDSSITDDGALVTIPENVSITGGITVSENITMSAGKTVDGVDVSAHASRHEQFGADELNIRNLQIICPTQFYFEEWWNCALTHTASGYSYPGTFGTYDGTGATNGSTSGVVFYDAFYFDYGSGGNRYRLSFWINPLTDTDKMDGWFGWFAAYNVLPTTTSNHAAIHYTSTVDGTSSAVYASNGAGAAETSTLMIASVPYATSYYFAIVYGASNIKYYYSTNGTTWTLGATHTTNRPTSISLYAGGWVTNTEAVDKMFQQQGMQAMQGGVP